MLQTFARTFSLKKSLTVSGFTEKKSSSTVTHTPCWHLPMQKVPESSTLSLRSFSFIRYWSCSTTWREPFMWQEEPMQTVIFICFTSFTSSQRHRSTSEGIRAQQRCPLPSVMRRRWASISGHTVLRYRSSRRKDSDTSSPRQYPR